MDTPPGASRWPTELRWGWPNRRAVYVGYALFAVSLILLASGIVLTRLEGLIVVKDETVRSIAYWAHVITPLVAAWLFVLHRLAGRRIRWQIFDSGGNVSFRAHADGQPGVSGGGFSQFQTALAVWRNDPNTPIDYRYAGTTSSIGGALNTFDGVNQILFDDLATPSAFDEPVGEQRIVRQRSGQRHAGRDHNAVRHVQVPQLGGL